MNAYELADLIGLCGDGGYNQDAATMLRKQEAQIEELKLLLDKTLNNWAKDMERYRKNGL